MNVLHIKEPVLQDKIASMWLQEEAHHLRLNSTAQTMLILNTRKAIKIVHTYGKNKAMQKAANELTLREALSIAQLALEVAPLTKLDRLY